MDRILPESAIKWNSIATLLKIKIRGGKIELHEACIPERPPYEHQSGNLYYLWNEKPKAKIFVDVNDLKKNLNEIRQVCDGAQEPTNAKTALIHDRKNAQMPILFLTWNELEVLRSFPIGGIVVAIKED